MIPEIQINVPKTDVVFIHQSGKILKVDNKQWFPECSKKRLTHC